MSAKFGTPSVGAQTASPKRVFRSARTCSTMDSTSSLGPGPAILERSPLPAMRSLNGRRATRGADAHGAPLSLALSPCRGEGRAPAVLYRFPLQVSSCDTPPSVMVHLMVWKTNETSSSGGSVLLAGAMQLGTFWSIEAMRPSLISTV